IIDLKVSSKEDGSRIEKSKKRMITNRTLKEKAMQMRNRIVPAKSFGKRVKLNKLQEAEVDTEKNKYKLFIHYQRSANMNDINRIHNIRHNPASDCHQYEEQAEDKNTGDACAISHVDEACSHGYYNNKRTGTEKNESVERNKIKTSNKQSV
ncbi:22125_t:CDS:2, partial [Racocetra persica]